MAVPPEPEYRCELSGSATIDDLIDMLDYGPDSMPRATEYRIHQRALALRDEAADLNADADKAFWDAVLGIELDDDRP